MKRFLTVEKYDGSLVVMTEADNYKKEIDSEDTACWVWQFADSEDQANNQHIAKCDLYDIDPTRDTY